MRNYFTQRQEFKAGEKVSIGFMNDLEVFEKHELKYQGMADIWLLASKKSLYVFCAYKGIRKMSNFADWASPAALF